VLPGDWIEEKPHWSCSYACGANDKQKVCARCGEPQIELLHVYTGENRAVKLFICIGKCVQYTEGWTTEVLYFEHEEAENVEETGIFSSKATDWEVDDNLLEDMLNMDDLFAAPIEKPKPSKKRPSKKRKAEAAGFFLNFVPEPSPKVNDDRIKELMKQYKNGIHAVDSWVAEADDQGSQMDLITTFQTRIERSPQQILRYQWKGEPLPFDCPVEVPCCPSCQSPTFFEFQIMPHLINILESKFKHLDYVSIFGFTCEYCDQVCLIIHREEEEANLAALIQNEEEEEIVAAKEVKFRINEAGDPI